MRRRGFVSNAARRSDDTNGYHTLTSLSSSELKSVPSFDSSSGTSAASLTAAGGTQRGFPGLLPHTRNSAAIPTCSHKIARAYPKFAGLRAAAATVAHFLRAGCQTGFQRSTNLSGRHDMTTYVAHISTFSKTHNTTHKQRHVCRRAAHSLATGSGPLQAPVRIFGTSGAEFPGGDMRSADRKVEPLSVMLRVYIRPQNQVVLLPPHLRRRECDSTTPGHGQCNVAPSAEQLTSVMRMRNTFAPRTHTCTPQYMFLPALHAGGLRSQTRNRTTVTASAGRAAAPSRAAARARAAAAKFQATDNRSDNWPSYNSCMHSRGRRARSHVAPACRAAKYHPGLHRGDGETVSLVQILCSGRTAL